MQLVWRGGELRQLVRQGLGRSAESGCSRLLCRCRFRHRCSRSRGGAGCVLPGERRRRRRSRSTPRQMGGLWFRTLAARRRCSTRISAELQEGDRQLTIITYRRHLSQQSYLDVRIAIGRWFLFRPLRRRTARMTGRKCWPLRSAGGIARTLVTSLMWLSRWVLWVARCSLWASQNTHPNRGNFIAEGRKRGLNMVEGREKRWCSGVERWRR